MRMKAAGQSASQMVVEGKSGQDATVEGAAGGILSKLELQKDHVNRYRRIFRLAGGAGTPARRAKPRRAAGNHMFSLP